MTSKKQAEEKKKEIKKIDVLNYQVGKNQLFFYLFKNHIW